MIAFVEDPDGYKVELINSFDEAAPISLYRQGEFVDLCRGPHIPDAKRIKAFKPELVMLDWMMPGLDGPDVVDGNPKICGDGDSDNQ